MGIARGCAGSNQWRHRGCWHHREHRSECAVREILIGVVEGGKQVLSIALTKASQPKVWWVTGCRPNPPNIYIYITALIVF